MSARKAGDIGRLLAIIARLRAPGGCPWDRAQTFATIAPYTIEEAYEVADAIAREDMADLRDELGDLLLQVVFHARMAEEAGAFAFADVVEAICAKMERRHPHVFGNAAAATPEAVVTAWEAIKAAERPRASALDGVAKALPALLRADKLSRRAARTGFDWPDAEGAKAKLLEEMAELEAAADPAARAEEAGDLLFAAVNWLRKLGVEPEAALRAACDKFEARFQAIEMASGFVRLPLAEKERLWQAAKGAGAADEDQSAR
ncbi:MAG: nucleoside triphosphate pyrophosphohydrolase [Thermaurantiacus tibetensis]